MSMDFSRFLMSILESHSSATERGNCTEIFFSSRAFAAHLRTRTFLCACVFRWYGACVLACGHRHITSHITSHHIAVVQAIICNLPGLVFIGVFKCMWGCSRVLLFGVCDHVCMACVMCPSRFFFRVFLYKFFQTLFLIL